MSNLMLDVGLAHEIKMAARRADITEADLKAIASGDFLSDIKRVLRRTASIEEIPCWSEPVATRIPSRRRKSDLLYRFRTNRRQKLVRICDGGLFRVFENTLVPIVSRVPPVKWTYQDLMPGVSADDALYQLPDAAMNQGIDRMILLGHLAALMEAQLHGEEGILSRKHDNFIRIDMGSDSWIGLQPIDRDGSGRISFYWDVFSNPFPLDRCRIHYLTL